MTGLISSENPALMSVEKINEEISQLITALAVDPYGSSVSAVYARINILQNDLLRRNIEEGAKSASIWGKWAIIIAIGALVINTGFSIATFIFR